MYRVDFVNLENGTWVTETAHDEISRFLVSPTLTRTINKSGSFTFSITPDNPGYHMIKERKTEIYIYKKDKILWTGCVLSCPKNMYGLKSVTCEGVLGYLNDASFSMGRVSFSLNMFLASFCSRFNIEYSNYGQIYYRVKFRDDLNFDGRVHILHDKSFESGKHDYSELYSGSSVKGFTSAQLSGKEYVISVNPIKPTEIMTAVFDNDYYGYFVKEVIPVRSATSNLVVTPDTETIQKASGGVIKYANQLGGVNLNSKDQAFVVIYRGKQKQFAENIKGELDTPNAVVLTTSFRDAYETGMEKINSKVLEKFGGMLTAVKSYPGADIEMHYQQKLTKTCGQKIVFGNNLVDYIEENSFANIANVIIPFGKNKGTSFLWDYVTIEKVSSGNDRLMNDESIAEVGAIQKVVNWPDVEDPATLKSLAQKELDNSVNSDLSVSVSAVDEVMTGVNVEAFDIGLLATVEIEPLGIERELLITSITNYLSEPEKDTYTLGKAPSTSTSYTSGGSTGSSGGSDGEALEDTGWNTATVASGFRAYNGTTSNTPQYRRIGKQVKIRGVLQPTAAIAASTTAKAMFTLPEGFKPSKQEYKLCQGSIKNTWLLTIFTDGEVGISRYGTTASAEIPTSAWLPFEHEFYVD